MSDEVRACVDCKHFKGIEAEPYLAQVQPKQKPECQNPRAASRELIYGKAFCENERNNNKGCGRKGKLWEPKKKG